mmetsp:Transcript_29170/g.75056  ORF Transcript_29170/g.75056 Transcript_29170/m.75056 type:complete len:186 (+) Transcript_29170:303-860(+)
MQPLPDSLQHLFPPGTELPPEQISMLEAALASGVPLGEMSDRARDNRPPLIVVDDNEEKEVEEAASVRPLGVMGGRPPRWWGRVMSRVVGCLQRAGMKTASASQYPPTHHTQNTSARPPPPLSSPFCSALLSLRSSACLSCSITSILPTGGCVLDSPTSACGPPLQHSRPLFMSERACTTASCRY